MKPPHIQMMKPTKPSSQIEQFGYDAATKTLSVKFHHGGTTYHYHDVPHEKYLALQKAESAGAYLGKHIKGAHKFLKLQHT